MVGLHKSDIKNPVINWIDTRLPIFTMMQKCTSHKSVSFRALRLYCVYDRRKRPNFVTQTERVLAEIDEIMRA